MAKKTINYKLKTINYKLIDREQDPDPYLILGEVRPYHDEIEDANQREFQVFDFVKLAVGQRR